MTTLATRKNSKAAKDAASIIMEFKAVYADAVIECLTDAAWEEAARERTLEWRSDRRISLQDAATCYASIVEGYNEFQPYMLTHLGAVFSDCDIQVTPAREFSVAVYLHVPDKTGLRTRVEAFVQTNFRADAVAWQDDGTLRVWWD